MGHKARFAVPVSLYCTFHMYFWGSLFSCWLPVSGTYIDFIYIAPILGVLLVRKFCILYLITSNKGGGKCVCPRSFVCLLARLLKNAYMDLDEMLRVDRCRDMDELINF